MERLTIDRVDTDGIRKVSSSIFEFAELGSTEFRSSELLVNSLREHGFTVEFPYMGMKTAFRAEIGKGSPTIGFLAEYDALPNGHSCGHNVISGWAYGTALTVSRHMKNGKVVVFGTPSEEGIGEYAGSKAPMAQNGAFRDIDIMFGCHPDDKWSVGTTALSDITMQFIFHGKASHAADAPEEGINALDAAVMAYQGINNLRSWIKMDKHPVIGMLFREAGLAVNVIPERAVLEVDVRSTSGEFLKTLADKVKAVARGAAEAMGATVESREVTPLYENYVNNFTLNGILREELQAIGIQAHETLPEELPSGSTDEANVSKAAPTGHIDICISDRKIPGHSDQFREAADPSRSMDNMAKGILATSNAVLRILGDGSIVDRAKAEFRQAVG